MKPISKRYFFESVRRSVTKLEKGRSDDRSVSLPIKGFRQNFVIISSIEKHDIFKTNEIMFFKADGACTVFYLDNGKTIVSSKNLTEYDYLIRQNDCFIKVSRSCVINFQFVSKVIKKVGVYCEFANGSLIPVSRRKLVDFNNFLKFVG